MFSLNEASTFSTLVLLQHFVAEPVIFYRYPKIVDVLQKSTISSRYIQTDYWFIDGNMNYITSPNIAGVFSGQRAFSQLIIVCGDLWKLFSLYRAHQFELASIRNRNRLLRRSGVFQKNRCIRQSRTDSMIPYQSRRLPFHNWRRISRR